MEDVLIAGGGTVGLSAAVFLARHGIRPLVIERDSGPQIHPRATGVGLRTVELLREVGLEAAVNAVAVDMTVTLGRATAPTLAAAGLPALGDTAPTRAQVLGDMSFTPARIRGTCPQNRLDRVLLEAARERGARVEYGTELVAVEQDADGVTAHVRGPGGERTIRARYLVAADGVRSTVRRSLGIGVSGPGPLGPSLHNVLFEADLSALTGGVTFAMCDITGPEAPGLLMTIDAEKEWVFHTAQEPSAELVRTAIGDPHLELEILSTLGWRARGQVADGFAAGRVFLVGDAAHAVPPTGAFGMNTGVADAHNLAWKLAHVLRGEADAALLDTYEQERRPVALMTLEQAMIRMEHPMVHWGGDAESRARVGAINAPIVHMGYRYGTPIEDLPSTEDITLVLDGSPGSRVPHVWVREGVSTLDLVDGRYCVFSAEPVEADVPVHVVEGWPYGRLLVRPDGIVASAYTPGA
ncbi:FAD-dependent monooxygenase [Nonomuraea sp. NPDC050536]|uniref:FAD-dependent monooxygenase n=1 Tax=Nonomuraea sp. NPDC050536 TaxID=3364366 RepID=UPI0037C7E4D6